MRDTAGALGRTHDTACFRHQATICNAVSWLFVMEYEAPRGTISSLMIPAGYFWGRQQLAEMW